MKKYLIYWFIDRDVHIELYDELSKCNSRKKDIIKYIEFYDDSDIYVYEIYE